MITEINPIEYFKGLVKNAIEHQRLKTDEMAEYYLSSLLVSYVSSENMSKEPLAITYLKALNIDADKATQASLMKQVGDFSLFMSGFFSDSLKRKIVDVDYYSAIGSSSYGSLAALHRGNKKSLFRLFTELALRFNAFAEIISEVSETSGLTNPNDILRLYEKWLKTGSKRAEKRLKELGIEPIGVATGPIH